MTLKELRRSAGYTQQAVAKLLPGVTQGAVSQWERGDTYPRSAKMACLAQLYSVTSDDILSAIAETKGRRQTSA